MRPPPEAARLVVGERLHQLLAAVGHEGTLLDHGRPDRTPLQHEHPGARRPGRDLKRGRGVHQGAFDVQGVAVDGELPVVGVQDAQGLVAGRREGEPRVGVQRDVPDRDVGVRARRPGARRRSQRLDPVEGPGDDLDGRETSGRVAALDDRGLVGPEHLEVRGRRLVLRGEVEPDLEQMQRVRGVGPSHREHLGVRDAGGEPLVSPGCNARRHPRSQWSTMPSSTTVIVSKPWCGCCGKPGTVSRGTCSSRRGRRSPCPGRVREAGRTPDLRPRCGRRVGVQVVRWNGTVDRRPLRTGDGEALDDLAHEDLRCC